MGVPARRNKKYYRDKGYEIPREVKRETKILVRVDDLPPNSGAIVTKICDSCEKEVGVLYSSVYRSRNKSGTEIDLCKGCSDQAKLKILNEQMHSTRCIAIADPEFAKLFVNDSETFKHTSQSNKRADFKCDICGTELKQRSIQTVYLDGLKCHCSQDGFKYPEKFFRSLLTQLGIEFESQKIFPWNPRKRYDFYLPLHEVIIEVHGSQHFGGEHFRGYEFEKKNDKQKKRKSL